METVERALAQAQRSAARLFADVVGSGLIRAGVLESELTEEIYALAARNFGVRRHWHKRVVRSGPNSVLPYHADPPDRRIDNDDVVYVDLGPVFGEWEADFGRTYVLGPDAHKQRLVSDIEDAFHRGKELYRTELGLTAGDLYDYVSRLANQSGWKFGAPTAGHLIGRFPHERSPTDPERFSIRHGNPHRLRELDEEGRGQHWILEIHFVDQHCRFGGFFEDLLSSGSTFEAEIGYSRAVVQGDWIFVSGTTGFDYSNMSISDSLLEQTEQCFKNIQSVLEKAGSSLRDVIRVTYVLPNGSDFPKCWPVLRKYLDDVRPAAMMVSAGLADPRMQIEIEVTALRQRNV